MEAILFCCCNTLNSMPFHLPIPPPRILFITVQFLVISSLLIALYFLSLHLQLTLYPLSAHFLSSNPSLRIYFVSSTLSFVLQLFQFIRSSFYYSITQFYHHPSAYVIILFYFVWLFPLNFCFRIHVC